MALEIVQVGTPVLREIARPLSAEEIHSSHIQELIQKMAETMWAAPGVGLAAPQIGESIQLIVIEDKAEYIQNLTPEQAAIRNRVPVPFHVIINPKIILMQQETVEFYEGCLSVSGFVGVVPRAISVVVECLNEKAESVNIKATGWYARILQHEVDHLNGVLCIDRMKMQTFSTINHYKKYWHK